MCKPSDDELLGMLHLDADCLRRIYEAGQIALIKMAYEAGQIALIKMAWEAHGEDFADMLMSLTGLVVLCPEGDEDDCEQEGQA